MFPNETRHLTSAVRIDERDKRNARTAGDAGPPGDTRASRLRTPGPDDVRAYTSSVTRGRGRRCRSSTKVSIRASCSAHSGRRCSRCAVVVLPSSPPSPALADIGAFPASAALGSTKHRSRVEAKSSGGWYFLLTRRHLSVAAPSRRTACVLTTSRKLARTLTSSSASVLKSFSDRMRRNLESGNSVSIQCFM